MNDIVEILIDALNEIADYDYRWNTRPEPVEGE